MRGLLKVVNAVPFLRWIVNRFVIQFFANSTPPRPHRTSLWTPTDNHTAVPPKYARQTAGQTWDNQPPAVPTDYVSWMGLVNRRFTGRHLEPCSEDAAKELPDPKDVVALFHRDGAMVPSERSSLLFCFFAQWFTDSFLRTHPVDHRLTTSNHEIDLCQIYGLDEASTWALRQGSGGLLKHRGKAGSELPPLLFKDGKLDPAYYSDDPVSEVGLTYLRGGRAKPWEAGLRKIMPQALEDPARCDSFYASGLDRGGSTVVYSAFNTIFLREHNRIARAIAAGEGWTDDNRLFEAARLVNICQLLNVVMADYIGHIASPVPVALDRDFAERKSWYRTNRITIEFDLLYRWHSMVPDHFHLNGRDLAHGDYRFNNTFLETMGVEAVIDAASRQPAGQLCLFNTPHFLWMAETKGLLWAREFRLQGFNAYRERFGLRPYRSIGDLAGPGRTADALTRLYGGNVDAVEFTVGLFAEKREADAPMSETLKRIVAHDAFTHVLTNPVLASEIYREATFSATGWRIVQEKASLGTIIARNTDPAKAPLVSLDWPPT